MDSDGGRAMPLMLFAFSPIYHAVSLDFSDFLPPALLHTILSTVSGHMWCALREDSCCEREVLVLVVIHSWRGVHANSAHTSQIFGALEVHSGGSEMYDSEFQLP